MPKASDSSPWAYRLVVGSAASLVTAWLAFLAFICNTTIGKQSVYEGPITFFGALLYGATALLLLVLIPAWIRLAYRKDPLRRRASYWGAAGLAAIVAVTALTQTIIIRALG